MIRRTRELIRLHFRLIFLKSFDYCGGLCHPGKNARPLPEDWGEEAEHCVYCNAKLNPVGSYCSSFMLREGCKCLKFAFVRQL